MRLSAELGQLYQEKTCFDSFNTILRQQSLLTSYQLTFPAQDWFKSVHEIAFFYCSQESHEILVCSIPHLVYSLTNNFALLRVEDEQATGFGPAGERFVQTTGEVFLGAVNSSIELPQSQFYARTGFSGCITNVSVSLGLFSFVHSQQVLISSAYDARDVYLKQSFSSSLDRNRDGQANYQFEGTTSRCFPTFSSRFPLQASFKGVVGLHLLVISLHFWCALHWTQSYLQQYQLTAVSDC